MANEIPVYLFVGFLESGKTKFIQETFEDPNFDSGDKTLLLVCEEGEEEYNEKKFAFPGVTLKVLEDKAELNPQNLARLEKESGAGRVVIEYNGMWLLQDLAEALPESWIVYQCIATADGTTALTYARDNSMRSLLLDKIARSELIVFNRAEAVNNDDARQELHGPKARHPIPRVLGPAQDGEHVLDVGGLEKLQPAELHEGHVAPGEFDLQPHAVVGGAEQHRLGLELEPRLPPGQHLLDHAGGLVGLVAHRHQPGLFAAGAVAP